MNKELSWIWFSTLPKLSNKAKDLLLAIFKSPENIYDCTEFSQFSFLTEKQISELKNKNTSYCEKIQDSVKKHGIKIIPINSKDYPPALRNIVSAPYILYAKGEIPDWENNIFIGIVGTRECTDYGISVTQKLAKDLAEYNVVTVSGLARGIDTEVAKAALECSGKTIAVLGSGIDNCYPKRNRELLEKLTDKNLVLSEFPPGSPPKPEHFPMRNRIISGISQGIIVVESPEDGGSLITAELAIEQGKDVFAVPGSIFADNCKGTNRLLNSGNARAVTCGEEIIKEYSASYVLTKREPPPVIEKEEAVTRIFPDSSTPEKEIEHMLLSGPLYIDDITSRMAMPFNEVSSILSMLEFEGKISKDTGNVYKLIV